ncbi:hypothetical protein ECG_08667 [Echinococcus granulosus]|nr:hypothetical protein ECG_08667 [Echinococcus granulosus]
MVYVIQAVSRQPSSMSGGTHLTFIWQTTMEFSGITELSISANLAFPDLSKTPGVHLNSQGMKLPASLGQKRIRVIENFLSHYQMGECGDCGPVLRWQFISTLLVQPK